MQNLVAAKNPTFDAAQLAAAGATLIAVASIGNSVGRLFWAWLSDVVGRVGAFLLLLSTSAIAFFALPFVSSPFVFTILITYTIASYGGGFGTIPSLISDMFGTKRMSAIHGLVLTGWATAGLIAPPIFGYLNDVVPGKAASYAYYICGSVLVVAAIIMFTIKTLHKECIKEVPKN